MLFILLLQSNNLLSYKDARFLIVGNIHEIFRSMRCKYREIICAKENNHIKQYLRGLAICQYQRNCKDFTIHWEKYKMWPKPLLHGLNLRKSLIKNCSNLILNWVIFRIKHN